MVLQTSAAFEAAAPRRDQWQLLAADLTRPPDFGTGETPCCYGLILTRPWSIDEGLHRRQAITARVGFF